MTEPSFVLSSLVSSSRTIYTSDAACLVLWAADYLHTLPLEARLLRCPYDSSDLFLSATFVLLRYLPAFQIIISLILRASAYNSPEALCLARSAIVMAMVTIGIFASQGLLFLRVYVIWGPILVLKLILTALGVLTAIPALALIIQYQRSVKNIYTQYDLIRCPQETTEARLLAIVWVIVFFNEALMTALTLLGGFRKHRITSAPIPLIFCRNGATYFMVLGAITACNVIASFINHEYMYLVLVLQHTLHAMCATRMILHIRKTARIDRNTLGVTMDSLPWRNNSWPVFQHGGKSDISGITEATKETLEVKV
ncbi:hypothetical protein FA15DRAFT_755467 [Coprinopsis marcescibilis]|uniref:G-protein coupled receptors family 1 profile domain-containing protein n=1 Tax=Coprinopsis marcescibilis TaxID=230819 RepID=A0A5C3KZ20_COPMA|nr:hypothetical protein FA15DRAFT_755467 [Coprinopsis marcescibilis]